MQQRRRSNSYDQYVAVRIRKARKESGLSLKEVAKVLGLSWQQVSKYESGGNRISAGRLFQLAIVLQRPIGWFYAGAPGSLL
jgi:transcriptional regulator with XRE-family HTH domain